ncbi:MAG: hypothetical protein QXE61_04495 [Nitrososphaerota archaeon]
MGGRSVVNRYKITLRTVFGKLIIEGESIEELEEAIRRIQIESIERIKELLNEKKILFSSPSLRKPKPSLEDIYRFTHEGLVEILKVPDQKVEAIGLVLFAYDPEPATLEQITKSTGILNAVDYLTHKRYEKYFRRVAEKTYALTYEGRIWVINEIIPKIKEK